MNEDEKEKLAWSLAKQRTEKRAAWQWANEESRSRFSLLAYLLTWTLKSSSKEVKNEPRFSWESWEA